MARQCELSGVKPIIGHKVSHSNIKTKRRFLPNLQRVKAIVDGEVKYIRVTAKAIKKGLVTKPPKRTWKKDEA